MAANSSDSRHILTVTPPHRISKDAHGSDNPLPLSPQWLLPKPGESKLGAGTGESPIGPFPPYGNRSDTFKSAGGGEKMHATQRKKDVFRPSLLDMETGRRERWREEERDTPSSLCKDRWREGDKEVGGDTRKLDRWTENLSSRHYGEARRANERWTDSGNKDSSFDQRPRDSKWNTRWGPDDKDSDGGLHEKWIDSGRDGDIPLDKGLLHLSGHGKDERDGDHIRPWRSNSSISRGRGEPPHQTLTPNKQATFSYGRGRGKTSHGGSSASTHSPFLGSFPEKFDSGRSEPSPFRYNRTKLLDVYRMTDLRLRQKFVNEFVQVPPLTQEEPIEPLALCTPNHEEKDVLEGIDKGDIVSSGAPQLFKDGSMGLNSMDSTHPRRTKLGSADDFPLHTEDGKDESADISNVRFSNHLESSSQSHEKQIPFHGVNSRTETREYKGYPDHKFKAEVHREETGLLKKADELSTGKESSLQENNSAHPGPWRASSLERSHAVPYDWRGNPNDVRSKAVDMGWSQASNGPINQRENKSGSSSWQTSEDVILKRRPSIVLDREQEARKLAVSSPEDVVLYYKDPQGNVQGPFTGTDIIGWFEAGYFGLELQVRLASASNDSPFSALGDAMPHLRSKAGPPPGFGGQKSNEVADPSNNSNLASFGKVQAGINEIHMMGNEARHKHGTVTDAENRFLESLMSGNASSSSQGLQGYSRNNAGGVPLAGVDGGNDMYLLARKMSLERQNSLPSPYPYWPGRDAAPMVSNPEVITDTVPHAKFLSSMPEKSRPSSRSQNGDLMSILQGLSDRQPLAVNNGVPGWSNFPVQHGLDPLQGNTQNFPSQAPFGIQKQRLPTQEPAPMTNLFGQTLDNHPSNIMTPEKLLSTGIPQDPQVLNMMQQQYLMHLQSSATNPAQQLLLLDQLLHLKQQQKQEEQQQQQLLSQVLSEQNLQQRFSDLSYGQSQSATIPTGNNVPVDPRLQSSQEFFHINPQMPVPSMQDGHALNYANLPSQISQAASQGVASEVFSLRLPHQMFGDTNHQKSWGTTLPGEKMELSMSSSVSEVPPLFEGTNKPLQEPYPMQRSATDCEAPLTMEHILEKTWQTDETIENGMSVVRTGSVLLESPIMSSDMPSAVTCEDVITLPGITSEKKFKVDYSFNEQQVQGDISNDELSTMKEEVKNVEVREVKKASEKKSRKLKSSKSNTSDLSKAASKASSLQQLKQTESENTIINTKSEMHVGGGSEAPPSKIRDAKSANSVTECVDSQHSETQSPAGYELENVGTRTLEPVGVQNNQSGLGQRVWKPAPGFKAKSLLEIQQEEQRRAQQQEEQRKAQAEIALSQVTSSVNSMSWSSPWAGVVANTDTKTFKEAQKDAGTIESNSKASTKSKKGQLHDLLAEEVLAKSNERDIEVPVSVSSWPAESVDDNDFVEARDTKKNRKKSAKSKDTGSNKVTVEVPLLSKSPSEKLKSSRLAQLEKELQPAIPSGPSLGDFVLWKGESVSPSPAPAWSTDSKKLAKPTSLRDILKEQEKKTASPSQILTPQKPQQTQVTHTASSALKAASTNSRTPQPKSKVDDDLFWGPIEQQSKHETKQMDFPNLNNQGWGTKSTPSKSTSSRQKTMGGRALEQALSPSPTSAQSLLKGKKEALSKHSEAMGFRDWCESECVRLIGTKDTSFLEYCLKQSGSEAEMLLKENLGSFDRDHKFIDKFLNYKELLPADVLEIAFQGRNDPKVTTGSSTREMISDNGGTHETDNGSYTKGGGGKKKGKKGKKVVSASVLGFNVVSNRIMMGEIQTVED